MDFHGKGANLQANANVIPNAMVNTMQQNTMANSMHNTLGSMQQGNIPPGVINAANLNMNMGNISMLIHRILDRNKQIYSLLLRW